MASSTGTTAATAGSVVASLVSLPEVCLQQIGHYLEAPDVLNYVSTCSTLHQTLGHSSTFWKQLLHVQYSKSNTSSSASTTTTTINYDDIDNHNPKEYYLLQGYCQQLPSVQWMIAQPNDTTPCDREGHLMCRMGKNRIVLTGGFTDDFGIYYSDITQTNRSGWTRIAPTVTATTGERLDWAYGASFTPLGGSRENTAIRFGGFQSGGYSMESCQVATLELVENDSTNNETENDDSDLEEEQDEDDQLQAIWKVQPCTVATGLSCHSRPWYELAARAYHTATLLFNRYLIIVGGMKGDRSVLNPLVLDTHTWTWHVENLIESSWEDDSWFSKPSPRFGHSTVFDEKRGRLVMFGGGNGSDLLRSGTDNAEVWELDLHLERCGDDVEKHFLKKSLPWTWKCLHTNKEEENDAEETNNDDDDERMETEETNHTGLSPSEKLTLGRCHSGIKVSQDTVLFLFGSGRPTTNGLLAYNLANDEFMRPKIKGPLPAPRFTFAATYIEEYGYVIVHGGYSVQSHGTIDDVCILDLAPALQNRRPPMFSTQCSPVSHAPVTDEDALRSRRENSREHNFLSFMLRAMRRDYHGQEQDDDDDDDDDADEGDAENEHRRMLAARQATLISLLPADVRGEGMHVGLHFDHDDDNDDDDDDNDDDDYEGSEDGSSDHNSYMTP